MLSLSHKRAARVKFVRAAGLWRAKLLLGIAGRKTSDQLCSGCGGGRTSDQSRNNFGTFRDGVCLLGTNSWLPRNGEVADEDLT